VRPATSPVTENHVVFDPLENGLDYVASAVAHLRDRKNRRSLKYATLHLFSGVEVLLKERLRREHWSLVFADSDKANLAAFESGDFRSVDFDSALARLAGVCNVSMSKREKEALNSLRLSRNRLQHYGITETVEAVKATASMSLQFVIDFVGRELETDQLSDEAGGLLAEIRSGLAEFNDFLSARWDSIRDRVENHDGLVVECPACLQDSLLLEPSFWHCEFCRHAGDAPKILDEYLAAIIGISWRDVADGAEWPVSACPECELQTLVHGAMTEQGEMYACFSCGFQRGLVDMPRCERCGRVAFRAWGDFALCEDCVAYERYRMERD
jgi:predicted RNA-binding Zn-ribbon protein involved in translation (DUF1610 family)